MQINRNESKIFLFMFEQMLQTIWICFYKDEVSFKEFLIGMTDVSKDIPIKNREFSYGD